MTREEKQKAIDALKILAPVMAMTQEEFNNYIQTLNNIMDWLEQEPCDDAISRENTLKAMIEQLGIRNENYLLPAEETLYKVVKNMPPVTPHQKMGCEGCIYEKTGNNSTYPCSHCSRCYTDKYKAERSSKE